MRAGVALVTGATRGIGRAIALGLSQDGFDCIATYRSRSDLAESLAAEISARGRRCRTAEFDVRDPAASEKALLPALEEMGAPTVLVNNAGITKDGLFALMPREDWSAVLDTSLGGFFDVTRLVVRGMIAARDGRIVNLTSTSGQLGTAGQVNYSAAKAGIIGATKALAREFGRYKITVNAVSPGYIDTDMLPDSARERAAAQTPLGRVGTAEEVASVVRFLASPAAGYVTGQVVGVNGGIV